MASLATLRFTLEPQSYLTDGQSLPKRAMQMLSSQIIKVPGASFLHVHRVARSANCSIASLKFARSTCRQDFFQMTARSSCCAQSQTVVQSSPRFADDPIATFRTCRQKTRLLSRTTKRSKISCSSSFVFPWMAVTGCCAAISVGVSCGFLPLSQHNWTSR